MKMFVGENNFQLADLFHVHNKWRRRRRRWYRLHFLSYWNLLHLLLFLHLLILHLVLFNNNSLGLLLLRLLLLLFTFRLPIRLSWSKYFWWLD